MCIHVRVKDRIGVLCRVIECVGSLTDITSSTTACVYMLEYKTGLMSCIVSSSVLDLSQTSLAVPRLVSVMSPGVSVMSPGVSVMSLELPTEKVVANMLATESRYVYGGLNTARIQPASVGDDFLERNMCPSFRKDEKMWPGQSLCENRYSPGDVHSVTLCGVHDKIDCRLR